MREPDRARSSRQRIRKLFSRWWARTALCGVVLLGGCTRNYFRKDADTEVGSILHEKDHVPTALIEQYHVYPDERARFADPTNPDRPPMPPDDPATSEMSPHPQKPGKAGCAEMQGVGYLQMLDSWDQENRAEVAAEKEKKAAAAREAAAKSKADEEAAKGTAKEKPADPKDKDKPADPKDKDKASADEVKGDPSTAAQYLTTSLTRTRKPGERLPYLIKLENALELGQINSREFQDAREDLYLTALPVTLQRFAFAPQFFAATETLRTWSGSEAVPPSQNSWGSGSNFGFAKLFSTGGLLLFNFANSTVINMTGSARGVVSQSSINLDLIQPFLRGGGQAVTLEPLTQAERNLVYEIRNFAHFRKEFYVAIAGGGGGSITGSSFQPTGGVIASSNFTPGAGVAGSSVTIPGVIPAPPITGNPGLQVNPGPSGSISLQTALAAPVSGYLSTLLEAAQQQIDRYNIEKLDGFFRLAKALKEGGDLSQLQVDQFEQQLLTARRNLVNDQQDFLQTVDQLKLQLGVPVDLELELDDSDFRPLNQHFQKYEDLYNSFRAASAAPLNFNGPDQVSKLRGELRKIFTGSDLTKGTPFSKRIDEDWKSWEKLSDDELAKKLVALGKSRREMLDKKAELELKNQTLSEADQKKLEKIEFDIDFGQFEDQLRQYEREPWKKAETPEAMRKRQQAMHGYVTNSFILVLTQARNDRMAQLHEEWPKLKPVCVRGIDALHDDLNDSLNAVAQEALTNRLDLMNVRGQVVDAWRQVAVFANALLGIVNPEYNLSFNTPAAGAQPLNFNRSMQNQLVLNTQLPLVRKQERNAYRAALINFQRSRRILQRAEDEVMYDTRQELILLRQDEETYKIQTRQVELAYLTVENSLDTLQAPAAGGSSSSTTDTATRAASLTNQLIQAQNSLYTAEFTMTSIWISYLNTRQALYRDMELMKLDERGVWIDDVEKDCPDPKCRKPGMSGDAKAGAEKLPAPAPTAVDKPMPAEKLAAPTPLGK